jgi:hypothetical protein
MKVLLVTVVVALAIAAPATARTVPPTCASVISMYSVHPCTPAATAPAAGIATWYLVGIGAGSALAIAGIAALLVYGRRGRGETRAVLA